MRPDGGPLNRGEHEAGRQAPLTERVDQLERYLDVLAVDVDPALRGRRPGVDGVVALLALGILAGWLAGRRFRRPGA